MDGTKRVSSAITAAMVAVAAVSALLLLSGRVEAQSKPAAAVEGWVKTPKAGETTAAAFVLVRNPTMYDVYVTAASSDAAGSIELRGAGGKVVAQITVPAYESVSMDPAGPHLLLKDLKRPLKDGDTVSLSLATDAGPLKVAAVVRKQ